MASALRCGLRAGPPSSRRSWGVPVGAKEGGRAREGSEGRRGGNLQACTTKTPPPAGLPRDSPNRSGPPPGPGNDGGDGSTPSKTDTETCGSPPDRGHPCPGVSGRLETEDDKTPKGREDGRSPGEASERQEGCGSERTAETEERGRGLEMTGGHGQQKVPSEAEGATSTASSSTSKGHRQSSATDPKGSYEPMASTADTPKRLEASPGEYGGAFVFPPEASAAMGRPRGDGVTYVNIPISPTSKKQLHYMELELQEPGSGVRGGGSTKYAQIDIAATETAHRVGTQHAQGREDRLQELEQKRKGAQQ